MEFSHHIPKIVFWQSIACILQAPYIRSIAKQLQGNVVVCVPRLLTPEREMLGWTPPDFSPAQLLVNPDEKTVDELIQNSSGNTWHVFNGIRTFPFVRQAFKKSLRVNTRRAVVSEACKYRGITGLARIVRGRIETMVYGRYIDKIFAIGSPAVTWFRLIGYPKHKIVPFAYFPDKPHTQTANSLPLSTLFSMVFIGQCVMRKGIDLLLAALSSIRGSVWQLDIIGDGKDCSYLKKLCGSLQISDKVIFHGALKNAAAMNFISRADLLILPSRWDGWGAVVNEALMRGTPVICSTNCGAADLLHNELNGTVFTSGSVESLRYALCKHINAGKIRPETRRAIQEWAQRIYPENSGRYFLDMLKNINHEKTMPPWLQK